MTTPDRNELSRALDALAPTPAMQRADLSRVLERRSPRTITIGVPLAFAGAACALFFSLARPLERVPDIDPSVRNSGDIFISVDDGTGPLVISISGG